VTRGASAPRAWLVLADGYLTSRNAKTAHGVIRYAPGRVAAVIDRDHAGASVAEVMPELRRDAPIVSSVADALRYEPSSLLLGVATPGGWMPEHWRAWTMDAISNGLEVVNGLHRFLRDDAEFVRLAEQHGATLWDVRDPPEDIPLFAGRNLEDPRRVVLTVGSDCAVGKMTVTLELVEAAKNAGRKAEFIATGQTGILIAGWGIAVDRVISDFTSGAAEKLISDSDPVSDVLVVEGQGSLWHPAYAGVTLSLVHGTAPEVMVLCHQAGRTAIEEPPYTALPPLARMVEVYEEAASPVRPARVACIAVNCRGLSEPERERALAEVEDETGLPAGDVLAGHGPRLWEAVERALQPR
jgi:uncharacterized NAD-dependent epimerase/dehydratase family protein